MSDSFRLQFPKPVISKISYQNLEFPYQLELRSENPPSESASVYLSASPSMPLVQSEWHEPTPTSISRPTPVISQAPDQSKPFWCKASLPTGLILTLGGIGVGGAGIAVGAQDDSKGDKSSTGRSLIIGGVTGIGLGAYFLFYSASCHGFWG
jgi:hypothetical protein